MSRDIAVPTEAYRAQDRGDAPIINAAVCYVLELQTTNYIK